MQVLLTGGAGFIGQHVLRELIGRGHDVRVLDSLRADVHGANPQDDARRRRTCRRRRARRRGGDRALAGVDAVLHLAAKVGLGVDVGDLPDYASSNDGGTAVLLAAMARAGVTRLTLASSMVVYGEGLAPCPEHGTVTAGARAPRPRSPPASSSRRVRSAASRSATRWSTRQRRSIRATPTPAARSRRNSMPPTGRA